MSSDSTTHGTDFKDTGVPFDERMDPRCYTIIPIEEGKSDLLVILLLYKSRLCNLSKLNFITDKLKIWQFKEPWIYHYYYR